MKDFKTNIFDDIGLNLKLGIANKIWFGIYNRIWAELFLNIECKILECIESLDEKH